MAPIETGLAFVAVRARRGPHVTPQVFAAAGGRYWLATPHDSLKARVWRRRPSVGLLLPGRAVVGTAAVLDPMRPLSMLTSPGNVMRSAAGAMAFAAGNMDEVAATVIDALTMQLGADAFRRRVLVAVAASREVSVSSDGGSAAGLLVGDEGVAALPCVFDWATSRAAVSGAAEVGASVDGPAAVAVDLSERAGVADKQGFLYRGTAAACDGGFVLDVERATWWDGPRVGTVRLTM